MPRNLRNIYYRSMKLGYRVRELARRYEPSATTIQNWKRQAKAKASESEPGESEVSQLRRLQRRNQELEQENAFLKKSGSLVCLRQRGSSVVEPGVRINRSGEENFAIRLMCRVLEISESGYYAWRNRKPSPRSQANEKLLAAIRGVLVESGWTYGAPRIAAQLCKSGVEVSVNRVARLMQKARLSACAARKFVRSTRCLGSRARYSRPSES